MGLKIDVLGVKEPDLTYQSVAVKNIKEQI